MSEEQDIYGDTNADELNLNNDTKDVDLVIEDNNETDKAAELSDDETDGELANNENEGGEEPECDKACNPDQF